MASGTRFISRPGRPALRAVGMGGLDITVLGEVTLRRDGELISCSSLKALELLGYLVTRRDRSATRETVAEALWPDEEPEQTRRLLRQALWRLNTALRGPGDGSRAPGAPGVGSPRPGRLRLEVPATAVDVLAFEEIRHAVADVPATDLTDAQVKSLEQAVSRYGGDLLAGWHHEWCLPERQRVREAYLGMREQLMIWCADRGLRARSVEHGHATLAADPARESVHRALMRLHHRAGDRAAAVRQFQQCVTALRAEYGVGPSASTLRLHQEICADDGRHRSAGRTPGTIRTATGEAGTATPADPTADAFHDATPDVIGQLQDQLAEIQATLDALLRAVDGRGEGTHRLGPLRAGRLPRRREGTGGTG